MENVEKLITSGVDGGKGRGSICFKNNFIKDVKQVHIADLIIFKPRLKKGIYVYNSFLNVRVFLSWKW